MDPPPTRFVELGEDEGAGNILAVQAWMDPTAYATAQRFELRLRVWLDEADDRGWLGPGTIVVLPEAVGSWLVAVGEGRNVVEARTIEKAMIALAKNHATAFIDHRNRAPVEDRESYAIFSLKAEEMADAYDQVMRTLAQDYGITIVGGTILLPDPHVQDGQIVVLPGEELQDVAFVYGPDGQLLAGPIAEVHPDSGEQDLVEPGSLARLGVVELPMGPLAVLPGQDPWFPEAWDVVTASGSPPWTVNPRYLSPDDVWLQPWDGYDGWPEAIDVDPDDLRAITLEEADALYGLAGRVFEEGAPGGVSVPLRGRVWDLGSDGIVRLRLGNDRAEGPLVDAPVVGNLWLPEGAGGLHQ